MQFQETRHSPNGFHGSQPWAPTGQRLGNLPLPRTGKGLAVVMSGIIDVLKDTSGLSSPASQEQCIHLSHHGNFQVCWTLVLWCLRLIHRSQAKVAWLLTCPRLAVGSPEGAAQQFWRVFELYLDSIRPHKNEKGRIRQDLLPPMGAWNGYFMALAA